MFFRSSSRRRPVRSSLSARGRRSPRLPPPRVVVGCGAVAPSPERACSSRRQVRPPHPRPDLFPLVSTPAFQGRPLPARCPWPPRRRNALFLPSPSIGTTLSFVSSFGAAESIPILCRVRHRLCGYQPDSPSLPLGPLAARR